MTALTHAISAIDLLSERRTGESKAAETIRNLEDNARRRQAVVPTVRLLVSEIFDAASERSEPANDGALSVSEETVWKAVEFARLLPRSLPLPEVAAETDGEICFDWLGPAGKVFSVSVNERGRMAYAGRFSEKSKVRGTEEISDRLPEEITRGVARTFR